MIDVVDYCDHGVSATYIGLFGSDTSDKQWHPTAHTMCSVSQHVLAAHSIPLDADLDLPENTGEMQIKMFHTITSSRLGCFVKIRKIP